MNLDIVFEDSDLLIINKPYGLVTHPTLKKSRCNFSKWNSSLFKYSA